MPQRTAGSASPRGESHEEKLPQIAISRGPERCRSPLEGDSPLARQIGITPTAKTISVRHLVDAHAPKTQIIWQQPVPLPVTTIPEDFQVFARERFWAELVPRLAKVGLFPDDPKKIADVQRQLPRTRMGRGR